MDSLYDLDKLPEEANFGMILEEVQGDDDGDAEYITRQRNLGKIQHRKFTGYDQRLPLVIYGFREETVHGVSAASVPHSLIVFRWGIQLQSAGQRVKSARLCAGFRTTPVTVTRGRSVEGGFEAGMEFAKGTAKVTYELSQTAETADQFVMNGFECNQYDDRTAGEVGNPDRCNAAEWQLFENTAARSGLPTFFSHRCPPGAPRRRRVFLHLHLYHPRSN